MEKDTELNNLLGLFLEDADCEYEINCHRSEAEDFRAVIKIKGTEPLVIKLAHNDFTTPERLRVWQRCAREHLALGCYCPAIYTDKDGEFPTVEFDGHRCVAWAEELSKYRTAEELGIDRARYWDDAIAMTAKVAAKRYDYADFPSAYCLFDTFCPSDKTDEVLENALLWKEYADTLPSEFREQVGRIWERWLDNRERLGKIYPALPTSVFQADLNLTNILMDGDDRFAGVIDFNTCGRDVYLNYLFRENFHGSYDEELGEILHSLEVAREFYHFSEAEKEAALPLYRCLKPLWFTRNERLRDAGDNAELIKKSLDETEYAQTREIDFASVM